jgi:hypothetical protein
MAEAEKLDFNEPTPILDEEDEATLSAVDRAVESANQGRLVPIEQVRERMQEWLTGSSSRKTL